MTGRVPPAETRGGQSADGMISGAPGSFTPVPGDNVQKLSPPATFAPEGQPLPHAGFDAMNGCGEAESC